IDPRSIAVLIVGGFPEQTPTFDFKVPMRLRNAAKVAMRCGCDVNSKPGSHSKATNSSMLSECAFFRSTAAACLSALHRLIQLAAECIQSVALIGSHSGTASGVDLTFATHLAASPQSECQIRNSTRNLYLLVVLLILTFAKVPAEQGCEC